MDILTYTKEHRDFQTRLRSFIEKEVNPNLEHWEKDHIVPREVWKKMGAQGFLCPCISTDYGGPGLGFLCSVIVMEEMARTNQSGFLNYLHSDIVVPYIDSFGTEEQKLRYLPG